MDVVQHGDKRSVESVRRVSDDDSEDSCSDRDSKISNPPTPNRSLLSRVDGLSRLTSDYLLSSSDEVSDS